jgi:hypothetical protein
VPYTLKIKSGYWTATEVQITAGYMNVLDMAWPRYRYTLLSSPDCVISAKESIMFNPDKYRSVTWLKGGRVYPQLDCLAL